MGRGRVAVERWRSTRLSARRSKLPAASAQDQPACVSGVPSGSDTNGTTSIGVPTSASDFWIGRSLASSFGYGARRFSSTANVARTLPSLQVQDGVDLPVVDPLLALDPAHGSAGSLQSGNHVHKHKSQYKHCAYVAANELMAGCGRFYEVAPGCPAKWWLIKLGGGWSTSAPTESPSSRSVRSVRDRPERRAPSYIRRRTRELAVAEIVLELSGSKASESKGRPIHSRRSSCSGWRRVGEDLEQLAVAPRSAAVLGRAGAPAVDARRDCGRRVGGEHLLDRDLVIPAVAEVVRVPERRALAGDRIEAGAPFIPWWFAPVLVGVGIAVARAPDLELVQVVVPPAERRLDDLVEVVERAAPVDEHAAPDRWLGVEQCDLELVHVASCAWRFDRWAGAVRSPGKAITWASGSVPPTTAASVRSGEPSASFPMMRLDMRSESASRS